ncbi:MAG: hypothetical protein IMZ46_05255 [Acidobacteria bacterium]|nr:hypothetical protein [Acidobacteriota bacterium]
MGDEEGGAAVRFAAEGSLEDDSVDKLDGEVSGWGRLAAGGERLTWLACGAATKRTGPSLGTFHEPRGCTSRKKRSMMIPITHRKMSYFHLTIGYSSFGWPFRGAPAEALSIAGVVYSARFRGPSSMPEQLRRGASRGGEQMTESGARKPQKLGTRRIDEEAMGIDVYSNA